METYEGRKPRVEQEGSQLAGQRRRTNQPSECLFNPLGPPDALKHHFTSLKTELIFLQQRVLEQKFPWN